MHELTVLSVGKASSALLSGTESSLLVDAGTQVGIRDHMDLLTESRDLTIAITHLDLDHCSGLIALLSSTEMLSRISRVVLNPDIHAWLTAEKSKDRAAGDAEMIVFDSKQEGVPDEFHSTAGYKGSGSLAKRVIGLVKRIRRQRGSLAWHQHWWLDDSEDFSGAQVGVLWPDKMEHAHPDEVAVIPASRNDHSMVIRIDSNSLGRGVVIAADCPIASVRRSVELGANWTCDTLVFPHHGGLIGDDQGQAVEELLEICEQPRNLVFQTGDSGDFPRRTTIDSIPNDRNILCTGLSSNCSDGGGVCAGSISVTDGVSASRSAHSEFVLELGPRRMC